MPEGLKQPPPPQHTRSHGINIPSTSRQGRVPAAAARSVTPIPHILLPLCRSPRATPRRYALAPLRTAAPRVELDRYLGLFSNRFSGTVPAALATMTKLSYVPRGRRVGALTDPAGCPSPAPSSCAPHACVGAPRLHACPAVRPNAQFEVAVNCGMLLLLLLFPPLLLLLLAVTWPSMETPLPAPFPRPCLQSPALPASRCKTTC